MIGGFDSLGWRMRVAAARGSGRSGMTLVGGKVLNVFTGELEEKSVSIADGRITAVGESGGTAELIDCRGKIIAPSFVDPHIHTESSLALDAGIRPRGDSARHRRGRNRSA